LKLRMSLILVPLTSLHVGGGDAIRASELSIVRDEHEDPFVPASTVRGTLRTAAHYAVKSLGERLGLNLVSCGCKEPNEISEAHRRLGIEACDVCKVWGFAGYESPLRISDFTLAIQAPPPTVYSLTRVSIDDYTGSKRERALYTMEYVVPGTPFQGQLELDLRGLECKHLLLLLEAMRLFEAFGPGRQGVARLYIWGLKVGDKHVQDPNEAAKAVVEAKDCNGLLEPLKTLFGILWAPHVFNLYRELVGVDRL